jgi:hypothetical protein
MRHRPPDEGCERARAAYSLELDGELSQSEREFLAAHMRACAHCERFAERAWAVTHLMRATLHETPERVLPVTLPVATRRRRSAALRVAVAAALVALAAGLGVVSGSLSSERAEPPQNPDGPVALLPSPPPSPSRAEDSRPRARPGHSEKQQARDGETKSLRVGSPLGRPSGST